jgi:hypothetical protein
MTVAYFLISLLSFLVLVLVSNQELGTGGPEECSQAKNSQVENIIHTWDHIFVQCCKIASYCQYIILCILLTIFNLFSVCCHQISQINLLQRANI